MFSVRVLRVFRRVQTFDPSSFATGGSGVRDDRAAALKGTVKEGR